MAASAPGSGVLELRGVCKRYGTGQGGQVTAADNVTFTIEAGAFVALTGASGSGKSTMLHMIGAIERPDSGVIISNGHRSHRPARRRPGRLPAHRRLRLPALQPAARTDRPGQRHRAGPARTAPAGTSATGPRQLLAAVGLAGRERSLPARMSGGEQQRIAIARALINTPALLLADEPTGNLDSANATEILDLLARLRAEHHMTILLASHDPQIAARSERLIRLRDGAVIDDIQLTRDRPVQDVIRHISQLG